MNIKPVHSASAPSAIGPYSQAIAAGNLLFCSGQIALDPATMAMVGSTAAEQCQQVVKNLEAVLAAAGASIGQIVRTTIYLTTMDDFAACNEVYGRWLGDHKPARATVAVAQLPKGGLVEIDCIAVLS
ncbi:MAG: RidA family protein [Planctomycetes bacterium]|nr:RidA family protein [Planctomycetota bacterium]